MKTFPLVGICACAATGTKNKRDAMATSLRTKISQQDVELRRIGCKRHMSWMPNQAALRLPITAFLSIFHEKCDNNARPRIHCKIGSRPAGLEALRGPYAR